MLIDEMAIALSRCRRSVELQLNDVSNVIEMSNNILVQLEAGSLNQLPPIGDCPDSEVANYSKEIIQLLIRIVESFTQLYNFDLNKNCAHNFKEFAYCKRKHTEILSNSMIKLLALYNTCAQMKSNIVQDDSC